MSLDEKVKLGSMDDKLVSTLRLIVDPPGKKGTWLKTLNDEQLTEVYYRLEMGQQAQPITKMIQDEWGVKRGFDVKSLARAVRAFKDKALGEVAKLKTSKNPEARKIGEKLEQRVQKVKESIDVLEIMANAILIQQERILALRAAEKRSLPFKHTDNAMARLGELCGQLVDLQIKLGMIQQAPHEMNVAISHSFNLINKGLDGRGPDAANALQKFLTWADKEAVHMVFDDETRTYVPISKEGGDGHADQTGKVHTAQ